MALIVCPECGKEFSDRATACPNCGCPIKDIMEILKEEQEKSEAAKSSKNERKKAEQKPPEKNENAEKSQNAAEAEDKKAKRKKSRISAVIVAVYFILVLAAVFIFVFYKPYNASLPAYSAALENCKKASTALEKRIADIDSENNKLQLETDALQALVDSGDEPFDAKTKENAFDTLNNAAIEKRDTAGIFPKTEADQNFKPSIFNPKEIENQTILLVNDTGLIEQALNSNPIPDYNETIQNIEKAEKALSDSIAQLKQITNPSEKFIIERLRQVKGIGSIEAATEDHDPNGGLHKSGSYTSAVYFFYDKVDKSNLYAYEGSINSPVDVGTDGGGQVEVYETAEAAEQRRLYVSAFDGMFGTESHTVYGTVLIRTSMWLNASQQKELENAILNALIELKE